MGLSEEMGDIGLAVQRAEDRAAGLQARAGASTSAGVRALDDPSTSRDALDAEIGQAAAASRIDAELARLKAGFRPPERRPGARGSPSQSS